MGCTCHKPFLGMVYGIGSPANMNQYYQLFTTVNRCSTTFLFCVFLQFVMVCLEIGYTRIWRWMCNEHVSILVCLKLKGIFWTGRGVDNENASMDGHVP